MSEALQVREKLDAIGSSFEEFKNLHEKSLKDRDALIDASVKKAAEDVAKQYEVLSHEVEKLASQVNRVGNAHDEKKSDNSSLKQFNKARRDVWSGKQAPSHVNLETTQDELDSYTKAFDTYMRYGEKVADVTKTLYVGSDPDGGNWITPPTMMNTIINRVFETSPMRDISTIIPISTHSLKIPENPNEFAAGWVSELTPRTPTPTARVAMKELVPQEIYAEPPVSQIMLEDSSINIEDWVGKMVGDKMARVENASFVNGTGVGQPRGFLTYANSATDGTNKWGEIGVVNSGASGAFTYPGLINLITSIKDPYQANASFLLRRQSVASIMLLQDSNGRYIFQPIMNGEFNNTPLFGYKLRYATDMPNIAAGSLALAFGDFKAGYYIVDRVGISTIRDALTAKPVVLFYTRKRVTGDVVDYDSLKLLRLS